MKGPWNNLLIIIAFVSVCGNRGRRKEASGLLTIIALLVFSVSFTGLVHAQASAPSQRQMLVRAGRLLDVRAGRALANPCGKAMP